MQFNLFGDIDHGYVDRYAGMGVNQRYKKLISKSNVDMVLNKFTPFTKTKNLKSNTSTNLSVEGTNIEGIESPVAYHGVNKSNKIYVNSLAMEEHLEALPADERDDRFKTLMKGAYVARADRDSIIKRCDISTMGAKARDVMNRSTPSDPDFPPAKVRIAREMLRQTLVAAQQIIQGCHVPSGTAEVLPMTNDFMDLCTSITNGTTPGSTWAQSMKDRLTTMSKKRSDYNTWADSLGSQLAIDFGDLVYRHNTVEYLAGMLDKQSSVTNRYYNIVKEPYEKDSSEASKVGHGKIKAYDDPDFVDKPKANDEDFKKENDTLELDDMSETTKAYFFDTYRKLDMNEWSKRDMKMTTLADALYDTLAGRIGTHVSQNPSKRLNTRALVSELSDNIYKSKVPLGGKHLELNLILDTSGSMGGYHIEDAIDVINCINKLALRGVISGNLMLSASGASAIMKLPINPSLLPKLSAHNGGEGFRHTMGLRWKELQHADYNVALTDGMLTDGHIDQKDMKAQGIEVIGLYTQRSIKKNPKLALSYTNGLNEWFTKSAVRGDASELIYYLIDNACLNFDMSPRNVA